jgi:phage terminase small subunit
MPPRPQPGFRLVQAQGTPERLRPPDHLPEAEREVFVAIVGAVDPRHFAPSDLPPLVSYAGAIVQERTASQHLREEGYVLKNGKPNNWLLVQEKSYRMMASLSMRLRLAPQSRVQTKVRSDHISAYERLQLTEGQDDEA